MSEEKIRNEKIVKLRMESDEHRTAATLLRMQADFMEAHAEGLHDEIPREGCPDCDDKKNRVGP
jgi:hypothetical protein